MEIRNRDRDAAPFRTKDGSTIRELLHTGRQSLAEASLAPGQATERHYHRRSEEIYLVVEGAGRIRVGDDERAVVAGDAVLIPPGMWHDIVGGGQGGALPLPGRAAVLGRRHLLHIERSEPPHEVGLGSPSATL